MSALLVYAFTLGLVAAVNPCGFPLLPAYLALFLGDTAADAVTRTARGIRCGLLVALGFLIVFVAGGALVSAGADLLAGVPWVMIAVGAALAALGASTLAGRTPGWRAPTPRFTGGRGWPAMLGFGVAYGVASLSCALPLYLSAVAGAFTRVGLAAGVIAGAAYALGMGVFVLGASTVAAHLGAPALHRLRRVGAVLPRVGGAILLLTGAYLVYYWAVDLVDPTAATGVTAFVDAAQAGTADLFESVPWAVAGAAGLVTIAGCLVVALRRHPGTAPRDGGAEHARR